MLQGMLPICTFCKRIRDESGGWLQLERYIGDRSEARFTHTFCADCGRTHYGRHVDRPRSGGDDQFGIADTGTPPNHARQNAQPCRCQAQSQRWQRLQRPPERALPHDRTRRSGTARSSSSTSFKADGERARRPGLFSSTASLTPAGRTPTSSSTRSRSPRWFAPGRRPRSRGQAPLPL